MSNSVLPQKPSSIRQRSARAELLHARLFTERAQAWTAELSTLRSTEVLEQLDENFGNILTAFRRAADPQQLDQSELARSIAMSMYDYYDLRGRWDDWMRTAPQGLEACERIGDEYSLGVAYPAICNSLGIASRMLGQPEAALTWFEQALRRATSPDVQADTLTNLADIHRLKGRLADARRCAEEAIVLAQGAEDQAREAKGHEYLGLTLTSLREYDAAIIAYEKALELRRQSGNLRRLSLALTFKAYALTMRGAQADLEEAQQCYEEARIIDSALRNEQSLARYQGDIAALYNRLGQYEKAIDYGSEALSVNKRIGFHRGAALNFVRLMDSHLHLGHLDEALGVAEQGFDLRAALTDFDLRMITFELGLARLALQLERVQRGAEARRVAQMALDVAGSTDNLEVVRSQVQPLLTPPSDSNRLSGEEHPSGTRP